jgi:hypothetical protein
MALAETSSYSLQPYAHFTQLNPAMPSWVDPNTHNNKLATYHSWFAIPFSRNERMLINVPRFFYLDLPKRPNMLCAI